MFKKLTFISLLFVTITAVPTIAEASGNCPANTTCSNSLPSTKTNPVPAPTLAPTTATTPATTVSTPVPTPTPVVIVVQVPQTATPTNVTATTSSPTPVASNASSSPTPTPIASPSATATPTVSGGVVQAGKIDTPVPTKTVYKTIPGTKEIITKTIVKEVVPQSAYVQHASTTDSRLTSFTHNFFLWFWLSIFAFSFYSVVHKKLQKYI